MPFAQIENLNFFTAEVNRQAIAIRDLRKSGPLLFNRRVVVLHHLSEQIGPIIFVPDLDDVMVCHVAPRIIVMESRGDQKANGLLGNPGNGLPLFCAMASELKASRTTTPSLVAITPLLKLVEEKT